MHVVPQPARLRLIPKLLADEGQEVCFTCHPQIADKVNDSPVVHPALQMENGCVACHSPHASDNEKLLLKPVKDTCVTCHDSVIPKNATVLHGPNNDGKCTRCHDPHGSQNATLLVGEFPADIYVPYTDTEYALVLQLPQARPASNTRTRPSRPTSETASATSTTCTCTTREGAQLQAVSPSARQRQSRS